MKNAVLNRLPGDNPWQLRYYEEIDSTNTKAKELAREGAPHGTVVLARRQSAGRGRLGRQFQSPGGMGVYLSVILRYPVAATQVMHLTCAVGVAMADAVERLCEVRPGLKWINDLVCGGKKLGGILTELSVSPQTGLLEYAVVGVGINCLQKKEDFSPELQDMAVSLTTVCSKPVAPDAMAAEMILALQRMDGRLFSEQTTLMEQYRKDCITLGKQVRLVQGDTEHTGIARDVDIAGGLVVDFSDGTRKTVNSGEVSVRGLYGYTDL